VVAQLPADARMLGLAAAGSWATGRMDQLSDVDLIVAVAPEHEAAVIADGPKIAGALGPLLSCFPGDHLGQSQLLICLYGPPLLHVDFNFLTVDVAGARIPTSSILWERDGALTRRSHLNAMITRAAPDLQWIEDRIWVWLHYGGTKAARGELFEAIDALSFIRGRVLGPLLLAMHDQPPHGVRRVEGVAGQDLPLLRATLGAHEARACLEALRTTASLYRRLREHHATPALVRRTAAEATVGAWLDQLIGAVSATHPAIPPNPEPQT
jgi:hypothetical protein